MDLRAALAAHRLVAIVRGDDPAAALRTVLALAAEGIELIEVSLTGKDALTVIEQARQALGPDRPLGSRHRPDRRGRPGRPPSTARTSPSRPRSAKA